MFAVDARSCMLSHDRSTSLSLLEQARNRDETAWGRLVDLYSPMVVHWCNTSGVRAPDSDDLVQDVFQAVFKNLDGFRRDRKGDTFRGWLRSITRFKVQDYYRRRAAEPAAQGGTDARLRLERLTEAELGEDTPEDLGALYRRALELVARRVRGAHLDGLLAGRGRGSVPGAHRRGSRAHSRRGAKGQVCASCTGFARKSAISSIEPAPSRLDVAVQTDTWHRSSNRAFPKCPTLANQTDARPGTRRSDPARRVLALRVRQRLGDRSNPPTKPASKVVF